MIDHDNMVPRINDVDRYDDEIIVVSTIGQGPAGPEGRPATQAQVYQAMEDLSEAHPELFTTIEDGAVTTRKIADGAVTPAKLSEPLGEANIADDAVTSSKLASGSVRSTAIEDGSVTTPKLADLAVTTAKLASQAVTAEKVAPGSITSQKLSSDAVAAMPTMSSATRGVAKVGAGLAMNGDALELDGSGDIETAVQSWLDAHPEASTTVEDGSITTSKLADGAVTDYKLNSPNMRGIDEAIEILSGALVPSWELGTFDSNGNKATNANDYYIRTATPLPVSNGSTVYITASDNYRTFVMERDATFAVVRSNNYVLGSHHRVLAENTAYIDVYIRMNENPTPFPTPYAPDVLIMTEQGFSLVYKGNMPSGSDLNDYVSKNGIWYVVSSGISNTPNNNGYVVVLSGHTATIQIFFSRLGDRYIRTFTSQNGWGSWSNPLRGTGVQVNSGNYQDLGITDVLDVPDGITTFSNNVTDAMVANLPVYGVGSSVIKLSPLSNTDNASILLCVTRDGKMFNGMEYNNVIEWFEQVAKDKNVSEINLFCGYRRFGVIGDSFASGYVNITGGEQRDKSWVEHMRVMTGAKIYEFSAHGMTCGRFIGGTFAPGYDINTLTDGNHDVPMFIIGLGLNDAAYGTLGTISDFDITRGDNPDTYYGNFASMIHDIDAYYSNANLELPYLFICDIPYRTETALYESQNTAIHAMVESMQNSRGNVSLVPLLDDREKYRSLSVFQINAHYTAPAQRPMAEILLGHLNKIMLENPDDFNGLTNDPLNTCPGA